MQIGSKFQFLKQKAVRILLSDRNQGLGKKEEGQAACVRTRRLQTCQTQRGARWTWWWRMLFSPSNPPPCTSFTYQYIHWCMYIMMIITTELSSSIFSSHRFQSKRQLNVRHIKKRRRTSGQQLWLTGSHIAHPLAVPLQSCRPQRLKVAGHMLKSTRKSCKGEDQPVGARWVQHHHWLWSRTHTCCVHVHSHAWLHSSFSHDHRHAILSSNSFCIKLHFMHTHPHCGPLQWRWGAGGPPWLRRRPGRKWSLKSYFYLFCWFLWLTWKFQITNHDIAPSSTFVDQLTMLHIFLFKINFRHLCLNVHVDTGVHTMFACERVFKFSHPNCWFHTYSYMYMMYNQTWK